MSIVTYSMPGFAAAVMKQHPPRPGRPVINTKLVVGAWDNLRAPQGQKWLSDNDTDYVNEIVPVWARHGVCFGLNPTLLGGKGPKFDFLKATDVQADGIIAAKICSNHKYKTQVIDPRTCWESEEASNEASWSKSVARANGLFVVNVHKNEIELDSKVFETPLYTKFAEHSVPDAREGGRIYFDFFARNDVLSQLKPAHA